MMANDVERTCADIKVIMHIAGLALDTIDGSNGVYTVTFYPDGFSSDTAMAELRVAMKVRLTQYHINPLTTMGAPLERLLFRTQLA